MTYGKIGSQTNKDDFVKITQSQESFNDSHILKELEPDTEYFVEIELKYETNINNITKTNATSIEFRTLAISKLTTM